MKDLFKIIFLFAGVLIFVVACYEIIDDEKYRDNEQFI
jgi:hypothetical protein